MNNDYMYAILCESELGLDAFGNPIGKPILLEAIGEQLSKEKAIERLNEFRKTKQFGDALLVKLVRWGDSVSGVRNDN